MAKEATDQELIERMKQGDTGALGILYMRYAPAVSNFAFGFMHVREDADDITHNIFCALWDARENLEDVVSMKAYLFTMTRNAIFKFIRHQKIVMDYESEVKESSKEGFSDGERIVTTADLLAMIDLKISQMPDKQQQAFRMSRYDNMTYTEIAERLGISQKTVQYYIGQALADLRKLTDVMLIFTAGEYLSKL